MARRIEPGQEALGRGLLVAGGAVDLAGEEETPDGLRLQRGFQGTGIEVVVLDGVARSQDVRVLAAPHRAHEVPLDVEGERRRDPVGVDLVRIEPLRLQIDLVALAAREAHDLVLDGGAVARPGTRDHARVHRRAIEPGADDVVGVRVGVGDPAGTLLRVHLATAHEGEDRRGIVP